ncbi:Ig-like domain-containing protein [Solwaraspora sp. WMMD1047]|uniref:Ig-like domain-containing protein n=1 Tax=Solwaraspora sp. WMMD1047 TaxID=3016102 RepID=UPI002416E0F7|nr:Ig-like domain-containing protein [Solwaraspora sp. WMMD1047]MDG4828820.1 Ig-like domain-containing protein [Solwaraspora sp. WMMD1047]
MRGRLVAAMVAATLTAVVGVAPGAAAGGQGDPLRGDVNGDGLVDRVTLGRAPGQCTVRVRHGQPGGGYGPARTHAYPQPSPTESYCPDLGVIVDLGGDGVVELVLGWFAGPDSALGYQLLVLRDFQPVGGIRSRVYAPSAIETADFDGDGRQDVYAYSDQGGGFISFLNTADGWLTPGTAVFELCDPFGFELADFSNNGGRDLLIWYTVGCSGGLAGVSVVGGHGYRIDLERASPPWLDESWTADALDANGDRVPDVRTDNQTTGEITHFLGTPHGAFFVESPRAVFDRPVVSRSRPTRIRVLANDFVTRQATVTIMSQPKFGTVRLNPDRTITYVPREPAHGGDRFTYRVDQDGKHQTTAVSMSFS